ncbi:MAG: 30S ribosomal protein S5 [Candidatus Kerfeldbacteria bacterium RIFCSPHIGHO2_02_FULL_42_14]|uniref:Small ribosomal subunit protein uS5 n=1 Tax=Candidatus Kerfeldbacteria bacterium RIFCSPHIGHO2_02_FULL_42_14 TaxID=1798540 RepID=A0A1G2AS05_9BACT|nr:MAG: 30S ribosomal protein S5 [Candidatus Kerfeldbacteria bacterium RIFCSPHIGHO2_02_FULL_42_14]OGY80481.1 MAG: 30S ribosomal protein S5 [Candidatus Kerfeldbacteria bacterium RIFCSPHIGHO2_12_FULL_42_13]OGY83918.1 MAG: 30S ribosomal protein S5 [Candidatus Kerfeldbacteria bacterium RIFCSPLOWO2_02_FULL_42_19]OGY85329.1 MAG: 30S ribosomal protein S5 [Candidatus Kerfeldbacteria bacterium RIFCSPLOWO2_12_FULL_43_9]
MRRSRNPRQRKRQERSNTGGENLEQRVIQIDRVARVMRGGKRMSFRACVVVGNRQGKIGMGVKKGADVASAVQKASEQAKKYLQDIKLTPEGTIPHRVEQKYTAARILLKPAPEGSGIIAGGAMRPVLELAGIKNVIGKMLGSRNKINNVRATLEGLQQLKEPKIRNSKKDTSSQVKV